MVIQAHWVVCIALYFRLARNWADLMQTWTDVDEAMEREYGRPKHLGMRFKVTAVIALISALGTNFTENDNWMENNYFHSISALLIL